MQAAPLQLRVLAHRVTSLGMSQTCNRDRILGAGKIKRLKVPPRFELRLEESESSVITNYTMGPNLEETLLISNLSPNGSAPGIEPGTSSTLKTNHTTKRTTAKFLKIRGILPLFFSILNTQKSPFSNIFLQNKAQLKLPVLRGYLSSNQHTRATVAYLREIFLQHQP